MFIQPNQIHQAYFDSLDQGDVLIFNGEFHNTNAAFFQNFLFPQQTPLLALPKEAQLLFKNYLALLKEEYFSFKSAVILRNLLEVVIELFDRYYTSSASGNVRSIDPRTIIFQQLSTCPQLVVIKLIVCEVDFDLLISSG